MNYESATDFELNKRLLELTCPPDTVISEIYQHRLAGKLKLFSHAVFKVEGCDDELNVNYCTDWNATMPLAVEHCVSFAHIGDNTYEIYHGRFHHCAHFKSNQQSGSPLRAIVICLIKVLEANQ